MKTDLEKLTELLDSWGVEYQMSNIVACSVIVGGYSGFVTEFSFTEDGKFTDMGAYEE